MTWAYVLGALVAAGMLLWWWLRLRRSGPGYELPRPMGQLAREQARAEVTERVAAANAEAAVELQAAATRNDELTAARAAIKRDPDGARRRRNMIALAERLRAESPP